MHETAKAVAKPPHASPSALCRAEPLNTVAVSTGQLCAGDETPPANAAVTVMIFARIATGTMTTPWVRCEGSPGTTAYVAEMAAAPSHAAMKLLTSSRRRDDSSIRAT